MVEDVRELGGTEVLIFSAMHESGHSGYLRQLVIITNGAHRA